MINKIRKFIFLSIVFCVTGCASLSTSQIESVNAYSQLLKTNSVYPSEISKQFASIKYDNSLRASGAQTDPKESYNFILQAINKRDSTLKDAENLDLGFKILNEYASALEKLSSKELTEEAQGSFEKLGTNINALIEKYNLLNSSNTLPVEVGRLTSKVIISVGQIYIKHRQAKLIKEYVEKGKPLITALTKNTIAELEKLDKKWFEPLANTELKSNHVQILSSVDPTGDYAVLFINESNKITASLIERLNEVKSFSSAVQVSLDKVDKAHITLSNELNKKRKLSDAMEEIQDLYLSTNEVIVDYKNLKED